jgi:hypothetical protein
MKTKIMTYPSSKFGGNSSVNHSMDNKYINKIIIISLNHSTYIERVVQISEKMD